jgi:photosystem II stability/assembly factor-like uncharacterized protein
VVVYGNGKFVVGYTAGIAYSNDGHTWRQADRVTLTGGDGTSCNPGTSSDQGATSGDFRAICYANGRFVAGCSVGNIRYSDDGVTWIRNGSYISYFPDGINAIAYDEGYGRFVAVGNGGKIAYSVDRGVSWIEVTSTAFSSQDINAIAYDSYNRPSAGTNKLIAVGNGGKAAYSTTGGSTWISFETKLDSNNIYAVNYSQGQWTMGGENLLVIGNDDRIITRDRTEEQAPRIGKIYSIIYGNGKWFISGDGMIAHTGTLRGTWSADNVSMSYPIYSIAYNSSANRWVAVGQTYPTGSCSLFIYQE